MCLLCFVIVVVVVVVSLDTSWKCAKSFRSLARYKVFKVTQSIIHTFLQFVSVTRYKKIGKYIDFLRQAAGMLVNPIMVDNFASLLNCTSVGQSSD